ncbi:putative phosphoesterase [Kribbella sp. VKM Ac-2527]|uniref:Putative phosphoesterase n=1 Tax=Kribbella caucasensis TaxID=2512215 RepID=A0A4R6JBT3_9ACTN|nr:metallophosphoesterase family protein [Kribbella sp. VKM Ac-2527]TDO33220.1 putative phosphoesterase [Kribbella sp. VKM Ac-2527]
MRVAVLADIHGNLPALEAVLRGIDAAGVDAIVLNGDLSTGPMPAETVERLAELGDRAIWVRGNADRELVAAYDGALNPDLPEAGRLPTEHGASRLARRHRDLLADLPLSVALDVTGLGQVRFCHATTRSDTEIMLVDSPLERYRAAFADTAEPTVVLGHTHMPFDRLADRRRFVKPGQRRGAVRRHRRLLCVARTGCGSARGGRHTLREGNRNRGEEDRPGRDRGGEGLR